MAQIFPALYAMDQRGHLNSPVVGLADRLWRLAAELTYVSGDDDKPESDERIQQALPPATHPRISKEAMVSRDVELEYGWTLGDAMAPYERLLADAMRGDATLFTREDEVEAEWRVVDPVLAAASAARPSEPRAWVRPSPTGSSPTTNACGPRNKERPTCMACPRACELASST